VSTVRTMRDSSTARSARAPLHRRRARRGFSLIEIMISLVLLGIGLGSIVVTNVRCAQMQASTVEYVNAHNACRNVLEQLQNGSLITRFQEFKAAPNFASGDQQVQIQFPAQLATDSLGVVPPATARFRDLDGDGEIDLNAGSTDICGLLPVRIVITRPGFRFQMETLLVGS
jgi:prepilin-type N-terminal cleavage/methylation domain-containing protein